MSTSSAQRPVTALHGWGVWGSRGRSEAKSRSQRSRESHISRARLTDVAAGASQIREKPGEGGLVLCHSSGTYPQSGAGARGLVELTRFKDDLVSGESLRVKGAGTSGETDGRPRAQGSGPVLCEVPVHLSI